MTMLNPLDTKTPIEENPSERVGNAGDMLWRSPDPRDKDTGLPVLDAKVLKGATTTPEAKPDEAGTGNATADKLIAAAKTQLGVQYVYGAHQWGKALDCSGLTQQAYAQIGIHIGGDTYSQVTQGTAVEGGLANAKPGDLIFTTGDIGMRANGHVGIYLGNGQVLAAPHTGTVVQIQDWSNRTPTAIRRYL